jgi:hypothetical protein
MLLALLFVIFAAAFRFAPHPMSFTPIAASLLFFGARSRRKYFWVPMLLLPLADVLLTKFVYAYPFSLSDHLVSWVWYAAMLGLGTTLRGQIRPIRILGTSVAAAVSFFLVSNFAVWAAYTNMYPRSVAGLSMAYLAGLPFFRNEVVADLVFSAAFFATPVLWRALTRAKDKPVPDHIAAA